MTTHNMGFSLNQLHFTRNLAVMPSITFDVRLTPHNLFQLLLTKLRFHFRMSFKIIPQLFSTLFEDFFITGFPQFSRYITIKNRGEFRNNDCDFNTINSDCFLYIFNPCDFMILTGQFFISALQIIIAFSINTNVLNSCIGKPCVFSE